MSRVSFTEQEPQRLCSRLGSADHYLFEKSISTVIHEPVGVALGSDGE